MKKKLLLIVSLTLVLVVITAGTSGCESISPPTRTTSSSSGFTLSQQNTGIWVTGEGKVSAVPDIAVLSLGVEVQEATVAEAQNQAATAMDSVIRVLDNFAVASKDIRTQQFSIYPVRRWVPEKEEEVLIGYRVDNTVTAKIRNVANTGAIIDAVARAGGDYTTINNISFTVDDPTPYYKEAREKAMADAAAKAKQLADSSGLKLGKPTYINESSNSISPPPPYFAGAAMPAPAPVSTPISPGETEITLTVQVAYSIE